MSRHEWMWAGWNKLPRPQEKESMKQRMEEKFPRGAFVCTCPQKRAFDSFDLLRKHQEFLCAITMGRTLKELHKSIKKMKAERRVQDEKDLRAWKQEKARGVPKV